MAAEEAGDRLTVAVGHEPGWGVLQVRLLNGHPLADREPGEVVPLTSFGPTEFLPSGRGLLLTTSLFEDTYGLGYISLDAPETVARVEVRGKVHEGLGELENLMLLVTSMLPPSPASLED